MIAQFDYGDTEFTDTTCETVDPGEDVSAEDASGNPVGPGFAVGDVCPAGFEKVSPINSDLVFNNGSAGGPPGSGVVRLVDGTALATNPTVTINDDDAGAKLPLTDGGVPFVFTDRAVTNNFTYFYSVSGFDVNSLASGPHTLRSARVAQNTVPRGDSPNVVDAELIVSITGDDGTPLVAGLPPSISSADGTFSGPFPPTNGVVLGFAPSVPRLLDAFSRGAVVDSLVPSDPINATCPGGISALGTCWILYLTSDNNGVLTPVVIDGFTPVWDAFGDPDETVVRVVSSEVPFNQEALDAFGIPSGSGFATADMTFVESIDYSSFEGQSNRRFGARFFHSGSRWFSGANESTPDPTAYIKVGVLDDVDLVWAPIHHTAQDVGLGTMASSGAVQCFGYGYSFLGRAADVELRWSGGTVEVRDVTHNVPVMFKPTVQASFGFLNTDANGNGLIDWNDFNYIGDIAAALNDFGFCDIDLAAPSVSLESSPVLQAVSTDMNTSLPAAPNAGGEFAPPQTATGFGLYINGERYIFELGSLPADGTVWTLRTFTGRVRVSTASSETADPSGYRYRATLSGGSSGARPGAIPGLQMSFGVEAATAPSGPVDLTKIHTVPDPYLGTSLFDLSPTSKQLMFINLPPEATIRIYTLTGVLVDVIVHDDITAGGRAVWSVRNRNQQFVASGVYFYHVVTPEGQEHVGKFTIIQQAGIN